METRAAQRQHVNALILFTVCIAFILNISENANGSSRAVPAVNLSPTSLAFGSQQVGTTSTAQTITLSNTGKAALSLTSLAIKGTNPHNFAQTNTCGSSVAAGANCTISVTFTPSASGGRTATVSIADNATGSPQKVSLSGTGTPAAPTAPVISLSPSSLAVGNQPVGTPSTAQTITLSNTGNAALSLTSLALTGSNAGDFAQTNNCGASVAAGTNCTITVTFTPAASGSRTASVSIADNATGSPQTVSLSGTGTAAVVSLSPSSLAFGNQPVGTHGTTQTITLSNTGNGALSITSLALTGTNAGDFAQTNNCGASVAAGANCTITLTFTPAASGSRAASVSIADNATGSPQTAGLSGTGTAPLIGLSPGSLAFGNQSVGTPSTAQTITLSNTGNGALSISGLTLTGSNPGDFAQTNNCGASVAAGSNCTITVTFTPAASGSRTASVSIADNATGSPQTVSLSGTGTAPVDGLSPSSLAFGNQSVGTPSTAQTITLSNTGNGALSISGLTLTGSNPGDFAQTNNCGTSVAAGSNCTITVTFTPAASGSRTASVSIADNATGSPQTAGLSGTGTAPLIGLSPGSLAFGNQSVGTPSTAQTITLSNTGNGALSISGLTLTGSNPGDFAQTNNCGTSVAAGTNCTITVTFTPAASGSRTASVSIADNATGSPQTAGLSGTGTAPLIGLTPGSLAFGNQSVGTPSTAQTITLSNTGNGALSISGLTLTGSNPGDFAQTNNCGTSVAAGSNCTITVTFTPAASGSRTASVSIADNAAGSPQTVSLSGTGTAPVDGLSPSSLAFGNQPVGTPSTAQTITLSNTGNGALSISGLTLTGSNPGDFAQTNNCGTSVAAGTNCTITVTFTPAASGSRTASVSIADNATGSPQTAGLSGTGTAPLIGLSPGSLAFGNQSVGTPSTAQTITLSNTGNGALSISGLTLTGSNPGDFAQTNNCGTSVAAGTNCTITVTFTPAASGSRTASVSIADNATGSPQTAGLSGTGTAAVGSLSPSSLAFGNQAVDMTSSAQTVTLSNTGNVALSITSVTLTGSNASDFTQSNTCGGSVGAGANCTIAVLFTPSVTGSRAASLSISDSSSGSPQTVPLSGSGTHDVVLSWSASATPPTIIGYYVFRGTTKGGACSTQLNSSPVNGTTYTDETAQAGQTYYYEVTAVASNGVTQSTDSLQVSATVPSP